MRDPERIDAVLSELRAIWKRDPDLRLGQLIVNAVRPSEPCPAIFYVEDEELVAGLQHFAARQRP